MKARSWNFPTAEPIQVIPPLLKYPEWMRGPLTRIVVGVDRHPERCPCTKCKLVADVSKEP